MKLSSRRKMTALSAVSLAVLLGIAPATAQASPITGANTGSVIGGTTVTLSPPRLEFTEIVAGWLHVLAKDSEGGIWSWGANWTGQLGNIGTSATVQSSPAPVDLSDLPTNALPIGDMAASAGNSYVVGANGRVYAWGDNTFGSIGDGTTGTPVVVPTQVDLPISAFPVMQIAANQSSAFAIGADGELYGWGSNQGGFLGDNSTTDSPTPVRVDLPLAAIPVEFVHAGAKNSGYAIGADGVLYSWGTNFQWQLGDGTNVSRSFPAPVDVSGLPPTALPFTRVGTAVALTVAQGSDGQLYSWGTGYLGDGTPYDNRGVPGLVPLPGAAIPATLMPVLGGTAFVLGADQEIYTWGLNEAGEVGDGTRNPQPSPTRFNSASFSAEALPLRQIIAGVQNSYFLGRDGIVRAIGGNVNGTIGNGTTAESQVPTAAIQNGVVSGVTFGGVAGTNILAKPDGTFTAVSPAFATAGPVDVVIQWTLGGVAQTPITVANGFTYLAQQGPSLTGATTAVITVGQQTHVFNTVLSPGDAPVEAAPIVTTADGIEARVSAEANGRVTFTATGLAVGSYTFTVTWTDEAAKSISVDYSVTVQENSGQDSSNTTETNRNDALVSTGGVEPYLAAALAAVALAAGTLALLASQTRRRNDR